MVATESTAAAISEHGLRVDSVSLGEFVARPRAVTRLDEPVDALIVATKASGLSAALERIETEPKLVLPLLNGLDHLALLRERFAADSVLAGTIRVEADRPRAGRGRAHQPVPARGDGQPRSAAARRHAGSAQTRSTTRTCRRACWTPRRR